jgi:hypothetical protein
MMSGAKPPPTMPARTVKSYHSSVVPTELAVASLPVLARRAAGTVDTARDVYVAVPACEIRSIIDGF